MNTKKIKNVSEKKSMWIKYVIETCNKLSTLPIDSEKELINLIHFAKNFLSFAYHVNNCACKDCDGFGSIFIMEKAKLIECNTCRGLGKILKKE